MCLFVFLIGSGDRQGEKWTYSIRGMKEVAVQDELRDKIVSDLSECVMRKDS